MLSSDQEANNVSNLDLDHCIRNSPSKNDEIECLKGKCESRRALAGISPRWGSLQWNSNYKFYTNFLLRTSHACERSARNKMKVNSKSSKTNETRKNNLKQQDDRRASAIIKCGPMVVMHKAISWIRERPWRIFLGFLWRSFFGGSLLRFSLTGSAVEIKDNTKRLVVILLDCVFASLSKCGSPDSSSRVSSWTSFRTFETKKKSPDKELRLFI